jgi:hypothetical protein
MLDYVINTDRYYKQMENEYLSSFVDVEDEEYIKSIGFDLRFWDELTNEQKIEINEVFEDLSNQIDMLREHKKQLEILITNMRISYVE